MITIKNIKKSFGDLKVLDDVSLEINEGEIYGIIGHSGAGKSTLLRCINGLSSFDSGSIEVFKNEIKDLSKEELLTLRRDIGMIFQNFNLLERKTVFENVALPLELWQKKLRLSKNDIRLRVNELLELVNLKDKENKKPKELSGGQKQRVAIARALSLNPKILLCDEATSALDPKTTRDILSLLSKINKELKITIVIVTHQMEVVKEVCEKIILLVDGKVKAEGFSEELFLKPKNELKNFLSEDDIEVLPQDGINIKIYFGKDSSENALITKMAKETLKDFSIVFGKLEKFREDVIGSLVINVSKEDEEVILNYLKDKDVEWEVI